ncbi:hypothetical protein [Vibrio sp. WXL210]|uniref:hypothetical protein n=1 Tax=Vibrio sp. WXL210 TaxID=3450709 RepID=UPI003EC94B48
MGVIISSLILATVMTQVPNLMGMSNASELTWGSVAKIALLTLPITFTGTVGFTMFYGKGSEVFSYPSLNIIAKIAAFVIAIFVQWVFYKKVVNVVEIVGIVVCMIGTTLIVFNQEINQVVQSVMSSNSSA